MTVTSAALPGPASLARVAGRAGLAGFALFVAIGLATSLHDHPLRLALGTAIALVGALPLFLLRARPVLAWAAPATAGVVVLGNADARALVWFGVVIIAAWCVLAGGVRIGAIYWAGVVLLFGGEWLWAVRDPGWAPWTAGVTVSVLATVLIRHELVLVDRLRAAQAELAEQTRTEERSRIARELHDVIAHSLTVSLLHVTSARLAVEQDPADASRALAEAERLGRLALTEVRATMGLLRPDDSPEGIAAPVPTLDRLAALVEQFRQAGVPVSLAVKDDIGSLPATVGSTIYRIVQESLTNAAKHAPGAATTVDLGVKNGEVEVRVDSAGPPGHGSGMGLTNMAERARALGGTCAAGPGGHGWVVTALLPRRVEWEPGQ